MGERPLHKNRKTALMATPRHPFSLKICRQNTHQSCYYTSMTTKRPSIKALRRRIRELEAEVGRLTNPPVEETKVASEVAMGPRRRTRTMTPRALEALAKARAVVRQDFVTGKFVKGRRVEVAAK